MPRIAGRPVGIAVVAAVLAANGIASLLAAAGLVGSSAGDPARSLLGAVGLPAAIVSAVIGLLLLRRAYRLWTLRPGAWLITIVLLSVNAVLAALLVVAEPTSVGAWVALAVPLGTVAYLSLPGVRALFRSREAGA